MAICLMGMETLKGSVLQDSVLIACDKREKYPEI